jgi:hypothetical protein
MRWALATCVVLLGTGTWAQAQDDLITGSVPARTDGAQTETPRSDNVPAGGCMPIGLTAKGDMVFPMQCRELLEQQRGPVAADAPTALPAAPVQSAAAPPPPIVTSQPVAPSIAPTPSPPQTVAVAHGAAPATEAAAPPPRIAPPSRRRRLVVVRPARPSGPQAANGEAPTPRRLPTN